MPTNSGQGYQEFICGTEGRESTLDNAMSQCDAFGLPPAQAAAEVAAVIDAEALLTQRDGFDPSRFQSAPVRRKPASPFRRG